MAGVFKLCYNQIMNIPGFSLFYLIKQFFFRIFSFLRHWYIDGFVFVWHKLLGALERLDRFFAIKITMRHWLEPLYQDKTVLGYILGFIFRTLRVLFVRMFLRHSFCKFCWLIVLLSISLRPRQRRLPEDIFLFSSLFDVAHLFILDDGWTNIVTGKQIGRAHV